MKMCAEMRTIMSIELKEFKDKMGKSLDSLASEYTTIRAGRANPHVLDKIMVEYYGTPTNLQQVANISVSEARTIVIQPWEASLIKEIEKAILNPSCFPGAYRGTP